jgi:diguanylate cyclase
VLKKILVIEDSLTSFLLIDYALKTEGVQSIHASNIDEAFILLKESLPDIIILDLNLPEVSGYDFLEMRHKLGITNIPVIVVSAMDSPESIAKTKVLGVSDFIAKPLKTDILINKVKTILG